MSAGRRAGPARARVGTTSGRVAQAGEGAAPLTRAGGRVLGYAPMLEQVGPREAVRLIRRSHEVGLGGVMLADVFQPWTPVQGEAGALWPVLAAAAEHTSGALGAVFTPSYRWHPAVVAQHAATMADLFPGRHWLGLSAGEALNDAITGEYWPRPAERIARLFESADVIGRLFTNSAAGKDTSHDGPHVRLEPVRLWSVPDERPPVLIAAAGPVTARRAGRSADGFITLGGPPERLAGLLDRFRLGAREAGRDPAAATTVVRLHLSWAPDRREAEEQALARWPNGAMRFPKADLRSPFDFAQLARLVRAEDFGDFVHVSADPLEHQAYIQRYLDIGFTHVYLHEVGADQDRWLDVLGEQIMPGLRY
ncbi:TIGR03557 family F420-dependent LLM class oxidoreductase [Pseudactinotalea sp. HY158]|uniref:TIGR03557 family F420-dependent LLM class oxidoreductase n=1 Tax=Pseudactinotalea sp. HY158 TaxID=2654547 RepID=UPI001E42816D|nr:TIGR03557 family F420-dependent LLM class oxidoreductase [Pseudactinotalea sp. HY158]